jgi:chromate reductase
MTTIVGIAGSLRKASYNAALLRRAAELAPEGFAIETASIAEIPLYNQDLLDAEGVPAPVAELKDRLAAAGGLLIATPEYNWGIPGVLKNAIDWLSRPADDMPRVFGDLPVGIVGAGGRGGTRYAQAAWLHVLRYLHTRPWFGEALFANRAWELFDEGGRLTDPKVAELLERYVTGFAAFCAELPRRRA